MLHNVNSLILAYYCSQVVIFFCPKIKSTVELQPVLTPLPIHLVIFFFLIRNIYHGENCKFNRISMFNHVLTSVPHTEDRLHYYNVSYRKVVFSLKIKGVFLSLSRKPFFFLLNLKTDFVLLSIVKSGESGIRNTDSS